MRWQKYRKKLCIERDNLTAAISRYSEQICVIERLLQIPDYATLRIEFVKCGNSRCNDDRHGPYCYAYWKESGKLRKRYLGAAILQTLNLEELDESTAWAIEDSYNARMSRYASRSSEENSRFLRSDTIDIDWEMLFTPDG